MKKYEFTGGIRQLHMPFKTVTLHRIRAVTDFGGVKAGELGGWIEKEENLSHEGESWAYKDAIICENAKVKENAIISENAVVRENAIISGNAQIHGNAQIYGCSKIHGDAEIFGNAIVYGHSEVSETTRICGDVVVYNSNIYGDTVLRSETVLQNADIFSTSQVLTVGPIGSRDGITAFYRDKDGGITVRCGCFFRED